MLVSEVSLPIWNLEAAAFIISKVLKRYVNVAACILTKLGKPNQGSGKHKGGSRDFRKKTHFKQYEDQNATNRKGEGTHFVSFETQEHLFSILIIG